MKKIGLVIGVWMLASFAMQAQAYTNLVGQKSPELTIEKWISAVPEMEGKFIIIDFWATWCPPCRASIPHMNELAVKYAENVVIMGLSKEPEATIRAYQGMNYYSAMDTKGILQAAVGVRGIPNVMIVDPQNIVCWQGHPGNLTEVIIDGLIADYAQKKSTTPIIPTERIVNTRETYDHQTDKPSNNTMDEGQGHSIDFYD